MLLTPTTVVIIALNSPAAALLILSSVNLFKEHFEQVDFDNKGIDSAIYWKTRSLYLEGKLAAGDIITETAIIGLDSTANLRAVRRSIKRLQKTGCLQLVDGVTERSFVFRTWDHIANHA